MHEAQRALTPPSKEEKIIHVGGGRTTVRTPGNLDELLRASRVVRDSCELLRIIIHRLCWHLWENPKIIVKLAPGH